MRDIANRWPELCGRPAITPATARRWVADHRDQLVYVRRDAVTGGKLYTAASVRAAVKTPGSGWQSSPAHKAAARRNIERGRETLAARRKQEQ